MSGRVLGAANRDDKTEEAPGNGPQLPWLPHFRCRTSLEPAFQSRPQLLLSANLLLRQPGGGDGAGAGAEQAAPRPLRLGPWPRAEGWGGWMLQSRMEYFASAPEGGSYYF